MKGKSSQCMTEEAKIRTAETEILATQRQCYDIMDMAFPINVYFTVDSEKYYNPIKINKTGSAKPFYRPIKYDS